MLRCTALLAAWMVTLPAAGAELNSAAPLETWRPQRALARLGIASDVRAAWLALQWDAPWRRRVGERGELGLQVDAGVGYWEVSRGAVDEGLTGSTRVGITPALRYSFNGEAGYFVEGGIGANAIFPTFRRRDRRFSTVFNFGDRLGFGWRAPGPRAWQWVVSIEHFSNGGFKKPNSGINFLQFEIGFGLP